LGDNVVKASILKLIYPQINVDKPAKNLIFDIPTQKQPIQARIDIGK